MTAFILQFTITVVTVFILQFTIVIVYILKFTIYNCDSTHITNEVLCGRKNALYGRCRHCLNCTFTKQNTFLDNLANISICFPSSEISICICVYNPHITKLPLIHPLLLNHKILSSTLLIIRNEIKTKYK